MGVRFAMSKGQWRKIRGFLPGKKEDPGRTAFDNRLFFEALLYMAREGCSWRALPEVFGPWGSVYQRFSRWLEQGVFHSLFLEFIARMGVESLIVVDSAMADGTIVPVHQHGTGARKIHGSREDQAIGDSRGGRTTKILAVSDEEGNLRNFLLLPGNSGESPHVRELLKHIKANAFIGDKAFDTDDVLEMGDERSMEVVVPPKVNRKVQRKYDEEKYKTRHLVENLFQKVKVFRRIATRYDKKIETYAAFIIIVAVHLATKTKKSQLRDVFVARKWPVQTEQSAKIEIYIPEGLTVAQRGDRQFKRKTYSTGVSPPE